MSQRIMLVPIILAILLASCKTPSEIPHREDDSFRCYREPYPKESQLGHWVEVGGAQPIALYGYGLVVDLDGTGDSPKGETERIVHKLSKVEGQGLEEQLVHNRVALVMIQALLPMSGRLHDSLDVRVKTICDAGSLEGGRLLPTVLKDIGGAEFAIAQGGVVLGEDASEGRIPEGAWITREHPREIVNPDLPGDLYISLRVRGGAPFRARDIVAELNRSLFFSADKYSSVRVSMQVADCNDSEVISVFIPSEQTWRRVFETPYPDYNRNPDAFLERVLALDVSALFRRERGTVVVDEGTISIAWTGDVFVNCGMVCLNTPDGVLCIEVDHDGTRLEDVVRRLGAQPEFAILRGLISALQLTGMLRAKVITR